MLQNSFVLLDGIGPRRELSLWRSGISDWDSFLSTGRIRGIGGEQKGFLDARLHIASERLRKKDSGFFATAMPRKEHWRLLREFGGSVAFLDIETTGISLNSPVTVVGIYDGSRMHHLVRGQNLNRENLCAMLSSVQSIVTFNGAGFDLPIIENQFPGSVPRVPHVDLRYPMKRLGYVGGLKRIERELGIERDRRVEYMTGEDAVYLWRLWERGGKVNALELLLEYNAEDCRNLKRIASYAYRELRRRVFEGAVGRGKV
jgi:hypothetical protein